MIKNNAVSDLQTKILPESTSFICKKWEWELFPISNFEVFLEFFENWIVTKRESIFIRERKWDVFLISERWFDFCVQNDLNSRERWKKALEFEIWSKISQYFSENYLKNIEEKIENTENKKLDKNDTLVTEFNSANQLVKLWSDWKLPALDGSLLRNIKTSNTSFNLEMVAWENIEAWSFVISWVTKRINGMFYNSNLTLQNNSFSYSDNVYKINFKKHPGEIKSFEMLYSWNLTPTFDLYKDERCTQFFLRTQNSTSIKTVREWYTEATLYEFENFSYYDKNYDLTWKTLYFKAAGFFKNTKSSENIFCSFVWDNNPFFYLRTEIDWFDKNKIYKANTFDKFQDIVWYIKEWVNNGSSVPVIVEWYVDNVNLSWNWDVYVSENWKITQNVTSLRIWKKINNNSFKLNLTEKWKVFFYDISLPSYTSGSWTTDTITINHNLWFIWDFQVIVSKWSSGWKFYWMGKDVRGFYSSDTYVSFELIENNLNSLKVKIKRYKTPDIDLKFLLL